MYQRPSRPVTHSRPYIRIEQDSYEYKYIHVAASMLAAICNHDCDCCCYYHRYCYYYYYYYYYYYSTTTTCRRHSVSSDSDDDGWPSQVIETPECKKTNTW